MKQALGSCPSYEIFFRNFGFLSVFRLRGKMKASLYLYIKPPEGKWRYKKPARGGTGKVIPQAIRKDDAVEVHPEGKYFANSGGRWLPLGDNAQYAVEQLNLPNAKSTQTAAKKAAAVSPTAKKVPVASPAVNGARKPMSAAAKKKLAVAAKARWAAKKAAVAKMA